MKLSKEQLKRIIKEELEKVKDTTGFFSGPGFDKTKEEDELLGDKPRPFQQRIAKDKLRKEELQAVMAEEMEYSLKQKVMSNISRDIKSGRIEDRYEKTTGNPLEVRKYVALLKVLENSNYDEEMLSDPEMAAGLWMDIFGTAEDQTYWDGRKEVNIRFSSPEIEAMCPDCGPIWDQVVRDNGMDGPGYGVDLQSDQRTMPEAKDERSDADFERGGNPTFDKKGLDDFMVRKYGPDKSKWPGGKKR